MELTPGQRAQALAARALLRLPDRLQLLLAGGRPIVRDGYQLDPQVQHMLAMNRRVRRQPMHELSVPAARRAMEVDTNLMPPRAGAMAQVLDDRVEGPGGTIPVRIYRPAGAGRPAPALVYFHGGGFVVGSLDSHDAVCRVLADEAGCVVIAVDYRLAPEHRFPAAVEDALAAFRALHGRAEALGIDPRRVAVGGDSAGGNLSAVVSLQTRGEPARPAFQLLIYPCTDLTMSMPSIVSMGRGLILDRAMMDWFLGHYIPPEQRGDPRASPLLAEDLRGAPPAGVFTAGFDPLRDEGEAYARKLEAAGVAVEYVCHGGMFHGFINVCGGLHHGRPGLSAMAASLRRALAPRASDR